MDLEDLDHFVAHARVEDALELLALDVLHDDERHVAIGAVLVDADDAGVQQAPAGLRPRA
jgi:hypothetical protein